MRRSRVANLAVAVVAGVVFLGGLLISGAFGGVLLLAVAVFLVVLSSAAWPNVPDRGRRMRVAIVAVVLVIAVLKLVSG